MGKRGRFSSNKRGVATELLIEAMQALAVILILSGTLAFVNSELSQVGFKKKFYAKDMGLMTTAIYSAPGNVFFLYNIGTVDDKEPDRYKFDFLISNTTVRVNATNSARPVYYWYFADAWANNIVYEEKGRLGIVKFIKEGNEIKMGLGASLNANTMTCASVYTYQGDWKRNNVIIDPSHKEKVDDKGVVNTNNLEYFEEQAVMQIADRLSAVSSSLGQVVITRKKEDASTPISKRVEIINTNSADKSIILSLHIGDESDTTTNYVKAYYNINSNKDTRLKSSKLGCNILNSILRSSELKFNEEISGIVIIPSNSDYVNQIIPKDKIGVLLELGNIQIEKSKSFLGDPTNLAETIRSGVEGYYTK